MATTITIPSDKGNPVIVVLNGVKYTYTAGTTVSVPDEVAALFEANDGNSVIYGRRAVAPLEAPEILEDGDTGIAVTVDDNGNLYANAGDVADAVLNEIYVDGHVLIIPNDEG